MIARLVIGVVVGGLLGVWGVPVHRLFQRRLSDYIEPLGEHDRRHGDRRHGRGEFLNHERESAMTTERYVRMVAGVFVLASLALGYWVHHGWFFFTAFVGLNLFQSAFTEFCPLELILRRCGVPSAADGCGAAASDGFAARKASRPTRQKGFQFCGFPLVIKTLYAPRKAFAAAYRRRDKTL